MCIYVERVYYKELAHKIIETGKSKYAVWAGVLEIQEEPMFQFQSESQKSRYQGEPMVQIKSEGSLLENSLLLKEADLFVLFKSSTDWMRPIYMMKDNLLFKVYQFKC